MSSDRKLLILAEGQTEETFVRDVLAPHLQTFSIRAETVLLKTKRVKSGGHFRGGVTSTAQVLGDLKQLLGDTSATMVTTLIDYYGLPDDFPGMSTRPPSPPRARVEHVEQALSKIVPDRRLLPHVVMHEYEAWLYTEPRKAGWVFSDDPTLAEWLEGTARAAGGPELVDEGPTSAPSKRLIARYPQYQKALHGPMAVGAIGLASVRASCPHMAAWLDRVEKGE